MPSIYRMMQILSVFSNRDHEVRSYIAGLSSAILVDVKEEDPFYVQFADDKIVVRNGRPPKFDATLQTDKDTMKKVISGELSQEDAFNRKLVETSGSISDAMRFRYVINKTLQKSKTLRLLRKLL